MSRIASLPLFHQITGQAVLVLGDGPAAEPKRRLVERAGGVIVDDLQRAVDEGVRLAFIAYEDAKACEVAAINARCAGMLVNVVDRPELCDFTVPSILDRDPVLVAVGTAGASGGLAKQLRLRLEALLPHSLGDLAQALADARSAIRARWSDAAERRQAIDQATAELGPLDPLAGRGRQDVADWLADDAPLPEHPAHAVFHLASDDPDDLTLRQSRLLGTADAVLFEPGIPAAILNRARADATRHALPFAGPLPPGLTVELRRA
jgi:uroporphyrin-III C-methyltransferase / precorrin-2 dehydrogenase / sirohydrochlorin ferrochelatase